MKSKRAIVLLAVLGAVASISITASAQRAGFRAAGIVPPAPHPQMPLAPIGPVAPFTTAPVGPFFTAPVAPFGMAPGGRVFETFRGVPPPVVFPPVQPPVIVGGHGFHKHNGFRSGNTVPNVPPFPQGVFPPENIGLPPLSPIPPIPVTVPPIPATVLPIPQTVGPIPASISPFPAGTTRAQVISQLGPPSVSIITSAGETLYFNGGATVVIQNGQVVTGSR